MPQENNPELRVIAHFILDYESRQFLAQDLRTEYFFNLANGKIMEALLEMSQSSGPLLVQDIVNFIMEETDFYELVGGGELKGRLEEIIALPLGSWYQDLRLLKDGYRKRELANSLQRAAGIAATAGREDELKSIVDRLISLQEEIDYDPLAGVSDAAYFVEAMEHIEDMPDFVPTRYPSLNKAIGYDPQKGGFAKGAVHALIGAPASGKSTFTISLLVGFLRDGHRVAYANYEIAEFLWTKFFFANCTGCNTFRLKDYQPEFLGVAKDTFSKLMEEWDGRFYVKHSHASLFFEDIEAWVRDVHRLQEMDVLIIDTLQSLEVGSRKYGTRWQAYEHIMMRLERLALDLNIAILITGQENINRIKEGREEATIADTGGSIAIEQKSAVVMHLIIPQTSELEWVEIQITKNRVVGGQAVASPIRFTYNDNYKGHVEYVPRPTPQEKEIVLTASRIMPDPGLLD